MNQLPAGLLTAAEVVHMTADIRGMCDDTDTGVSVQLRYASGQGFDSRTGVFASTSSSDTVICHRAPLSAKDVERSGGLYRMGDTSFHVSSESLTSTPDETTAIYDTTTGERWDVITVQRDVLGAHFDIVARRAGG